MINKGYGYSKLQVWHEQDLKAEIILACPCDCESTSLEYKVVLAQFRKRKNRNSCSSKFIAWKIQADKLSEQSSLSILWKIVKDTLAPVQPKERHH